MAFQGHLSNYDEQLVTRRYHRCRLPEGDSTRCPVRWRFYGGPEQPRHQEDSGGGKLAEAVYTPEAPLQTSVPPVTDWNIEASLVLSDYFLLLLLAGFLFFVAIFVLANKTLFF